MRSWLLLCAALVACARQPATPTTALPVDSGFVSAPGARLFYKSIGKGDPILVVHGGPGMDHTYLLPGMRGLAVNRRVVFYDQRGSGRTEGEVDSSTVSFDRFVEDVEAIRATLGLGKVAVLGHSWGGLVAMRYAAQYPERLQALVLMNTVEPGRKYATQSMQLMRRKQTPEDSAAFAEILRSPGLRQRDTAAVNAMLRVAFRGTFADRSLANQLAINLDPRTARNMGRVATLVMGSSGATDLWREAATIKVPTLIVQGAEDAMPMAMPRELAETIPGAQLRVIEGAGHFPYIEKPAETFAAINNFLASTPSDKRLPVKVSPRP